MDVKQRSCVGWEVSALDVHLLAADADSFHLTAQFEGRHDLANIYCCSTTTDHIMDTSQAEPYTHFWNVAHVQI